MDLRELGTSMCLGMLLFLPVSASASCRLLMSAIQYPPPFFPGKTSEIIDLTTPEKIKG